MSKIKDLLMVDCGKIFTIDGVKFVKLEHDGDADFVLCVDTLPGCAQFEDDDSEREGHNNFVCSNLEKVTERWVREEHKPIFDAIVERPIDLTTMDGMTDYADGCVIKGDIYHFFQSIDRRMLKAMLAVRFQDPRLQSLLWKYIDAVCEGLALGHQTSHVYAVFFVCSIMHFVGEKLHLPLAGMYMDDWYIICPDMATARWALRCVKAEFERLGLKLNNKTNIFPLRNGIDFCGFHTYLTQTGKVVKKLRYASIKRMKRRIKKWEEQYAAGEISREKIMECFGSWEAHAKHGDTKQLREDMRARLLAALARAEERRRKAGIRAPFPGLPERRTPRYGTVDF